MKVRFLLIAFILICFFCIQIFAQGGLLKRVAVINFEDKSGYGHNIGEGIADMLVTSLVESKKFMVIERAELDEILKEQGLGMSGAVTQQSAAKVGQLLGIELMVTGSISEFGDKEKKVGGGLGRLGGLNIGVSKKTARVAVDIRLVNVNTGEITMAKSAVGEDNSTGLDNVGVEDIDFHNSSTWDDTQLGKASRKAIEECIDYISEAMKDIPWAGKIILNKDNIIYMKPGSTGGVETGMEFNVFRPGEDLIDPDTGLSLGSEEKKIGVIQVTGDVPGGKACKAIIKSGTGIDKGDIVRKK
jgi:curli biogenesis system outer membrane secretion channel CsgG